MLTVWAAVHPVRAQPIGFGKSTLDGTTLKDPTSLQFGPDNRLYVSQQDGTIHVYDVVRDGPNDYAVTATETIDLIKNIPNHDDDGTLNTEETTRQVTGLLVVGTAANPVIYVSSSDPRISVANDSGLDTNSGMISRLTWNGASWVKLDLVRGLPRSEENHSCNGMVLDKGTNTLYVAQGGHTNMGAPANKFSFTPEYALSAAILSIDLTAIGETTYDIPTLDDPARPNTGPGGSDQHDPFGGNDGANQARIVPGGPVQIYSPGYRNAYDIVVTQNGRMYTVDNGSNNSWGGPPVNEGVNGTCTNGVQESGTVTDDDSLIYVKNAGHYGGFPNPTRANTANTFNGQSPVPAGNPIECDYRTPGPSLAAGQNGALATWEHSTNGLTEYTASNFNSAMQGNLLAACWDGTIQRVALNTAGDAATLVETLFTQVGFRTLDVTALGDADFLPGTIWACNHASNTVIVFEPNDYDGGGGGCTGADDPLLDEDNDGYTNADELDNGTNPCSAGDVPPDADGDLISDLNDPDDDNDTISDTTDPFPIDPHNGRTTFMPIHYDWALGNPGTGLFGLGFTGLMSDGVTDYLQLFDEQAIIGGGAAGIVTIDAVPNGDALGALNTQRFGFQFGVNVSMTTGPCVAATRIEPPYFDGQPTPNQSFGLFIGSGDQDNYLKITLAATATGVAIDVVHEAGGTVISSQRYTNPQLAGSTMIDLRLIVDPINGTAQPHYIVNGVNAQNAGPVINLQGALLNVVRNAPALAVGLISTSRSTGQFAASWDEITVVPVNTGAKAQIVIDPNNDSINGSTFVNGSFKVINQSTVSVEISKVRFDFRTAIFPDMVFDPNGVAGDVRAKPFTHNSTNDNTVLAGHLLTSPHDDGFDILDVTWNDFDPTEMTTFSIDVDPTSIRGVSAPGPNESGSVSGLEIVGCEITVWFEDGTVLKGTPYRIPNSLDGAQVTLKPGLLPGPILTLQGATPPVTVNNTQQTVRITGPPGAAGKLLVVEAGLYTDGVPGGGFDLDPFEVNSAVALSEQAFVVGPAGTLDVLLSLAPSQPDAGTFLISAVFVDGQGDTGALSNLIVVEVDAQLESPSVVATIPANGALNVRRDASIIADILDLPNDEGIDPGTLNESTVFITKQSNGELVPASLNPDGAFSSFALTPIGFLEPNATYKLTVTDQLRDQAGASFEPFMMQFTTGTEGGPPDGPIAFEKVVLPTTQGTQYTTVAIGPDEKLYGVTKEGQIHRWPLAPDGTTGAKDVLNALQIVEGGPRLAIGLAFDPAATADNLIAWVTHSTFGFQNMPDWGGKLSRLSGPNLENVQDFLVGLPRSAKDHVTNSAAFGPDGKLYFLQGSNTSMGAPDSKWGFRPERLLSGALLRFDPSMVVTPPLNVQTEAGGIYDPYAPAAPLTIYATGIRNAYDMIWHSSGQLYTPTNGGASGGNAPEGVNGTGCYDGSVYNGPNVPELQNINTQTDLLFRVEPGGYYGHPNTLRCEFVLNGGNPTAGVDPVEVAVYPVGTNPDANYRGAVHDLGLKASANGAIEYKSGHFNGDLHEAMLIVRYSAGDDILVVRPSPDGLTIADAESGYPGLTGLNNPLDIIEDVDNGFLYVSEFGSSRITLLRPIVASPSPDITVDPLELVFDTVKGTNSDPQTITITSTGLGTLFVSAVNLSGSDASVFEITDDGASGELLLPGETSPVSVRFVPGASVVGVKSAVLEIHTNDPDQPVLGVPLFGLSTAGLEGGNEPPFQSVVNTLGFAINVGGTALSLGTNANPIGDEVIEPLFERSSPQPVVMVPVARYSPDFVLPYGYYLPNGANPVRNEVGQLSGSSNPPEHQTLYPAMISGGLTFDPGSSVFGFYTTSPSHSAYTEDSLNNLLHPSNVEHAARVYPLKNRQGTLVPNAYLIGFEEANNGDYQDYVFAIYNVQPAQPMLPALNFAPSLLSFQRTTDAPTDSKSTTITADDQTLPTVALEAFEDGTNQPPSWLSIPGGATAGGSIQVGVDATSLSIGVHNATVRATAPGYQQAVLLVALTVLPDVDGYTILESELADRTSPVLLGSRPITGDLFAFVLPTANIDEILFWLDDPERTGTHIQRERNAPFDFAGGGGSAANPFDTTQLSDGFHNITAVLELLSGGSLVLQTDFVVANNGPFIPADADADGDVDQDDNALFQACLTGPNIGPPDVGCERFDFDNDDDVDQSDYGTFQGCLSGAEIPADPACHE